ncbi:SRPBCC family protein [Agromyces sp. NPDC058104]|uniref:SRPBCC family protein n=1 Tax=Agromyces sp. NPDC058104 TaxID=3346342 RepID=UPI0036DCE1C5
MSTTVTASTDVDVPIRVAYDQWTQFETFPEFLTGVDEVTQLDDDLTHWVVSIGGVRREFDADISDQAPDDHIAWRSSGEVLHRGRVQFAAEGPDRTRIDLELEWEPEGFVEHAGAALQIDDLQVKRDLNRFKEFVEERGVETGGWRGEIHRGGTLPTAPRGAGHDDGTRGSDPDLTV